MLAVSCAVTALSAALAAPPQFAIEFDASVTDRPYTGRVYIVTADSGSQDPLAAINWFDPQPFFAQDVKNWQPGDTLRFDPGRCLGYPNNLDRLPAGRYRARAVIDLNGWSHDVIAAPGNGISDVVTFTHDHDRPPAVLFKIDTKLPPPRLIDTDDVKYIRFKSQRLSAFHGKDVHMLAAVGLPEAYRDDKRREFPAVYAISGFGGTIRDGFFLSMMAGLLQSADFDAVVVLLDADCPTGHHVFADSANNGPCGTALVRELIPHLEERFRLIKRQDARFVTGASSGGWSSLWLQITYPDVFGGVWCMSPDPVDFSTFQHVDIYAPYANFFYDASGNLRQLSRAGLFGKAILTHDFDRMECVLGRGGQLYSFNAVFSPRGADGRPMSLWDHRTGKVEPRVAKAWEAYDIRRIIDSNWKSLEPKLRGKLHLFCGDRDDFFLEQPFNKLRETLERLGSDAHIEVVPYAGHMLPPMTWLRAARQMKTRFEATDRASGKP